MRREAASFGPNIAHIEFRSPSYALDLGGRKGAVDSLVDLLARDSSISRVRLDDEGGQLTSLVEQAHLFRMKQVHLAERIARIENEVWQKVFLGRVISSIVKVSLEARMTMLSSQVQAIKDEVLLLSKRAAIRALQSNDILFAERREWLDPRSVNERKKVSLRRLMQAATGVYIYMFRRKDPEGNEVEMLEDCVLRVE